MLFIVICAFARSSHAAQLFGGRFELRDALTFHIVNPGARDFTVRIRWRDPYQVQMDRPLMVRVFDPDEKLLERHYDSGKRVAAPATEAPWHALELPVRADGEGVYQVAVNAFAGAEMEFEIEPPLKWGVYASPTLVVKSEGLTRAWFEIAEGSDNMTVHGRGALRRVSVDDAHGANRLAMRETQTVGTLTLQSHADRLHSMTIETAGRCEFDFGPGAVILCPDEATARAIGGGATRLADGSICHHKFQIRAHELLNRYRAMPASAFEVPVPNLSQYGRAWLAEPERNKLLLGQSGVYATLEAVLREQDLNPASPTFGQIHIWRETVPQSHRVLTAVAALAAVYSIDEPFNPLYRNEALRNRIIIATLQDLMMLREPELPDPVVALYAGGDRAFTFARLTRGFPLVVRDCPPEVREVWTEAVQRYADRMSITQVASTVNQWSFITRGLLQVAEGVDDPHYQRLVQQHIEWLLTSNQFGHGRRAAGYFEENEGPDATYSGIALHNLGWIWERTRHEELREALHNCYTLFNHTTAPEPDGTLLGTSSFSHRTGETWLHLQFGGGVAMLADDCAAASAMVGHVWLSPPRARTAAQRRIRERELLQSLRYMPVDIFTDRTVGLPSIAGAPELTFALWEHYATDPLAGKFSVVADERFARNFGDEFFCVRRPGYYAFLYAGAPMGKWQESRRPADPRQMHPRNGGGLCMFWSPGFGSSINARNWSAFAAHCLIAQHDKGADWEDYWSIARRFDADAGTASITGRIRNQPLTFRRDYAFHDDRIDCALTITAQESLQLGSFSETFPFPVDKPGNMRVVLLDARGRPVASGAAWAIAFQNRSSDEAHLIVFDEPRPCTVSRETGTDERGKPHEHGCVLTAIPSQWSANEVRTLRWSIMALPRERVESAVIAAVARFGR